MTIQKTKKIIEQELSKIADLFHIKLDSINRRAGSIDLIKVKTIDEHISMEVTPLNSQLFSDKILASTSNNTKEK